MKLLIDTIDEIGKAVSFEVQSAYENEEVNRLYHYWQLLSMYADEITRFCGIEMDTILYSELYWSSKFIRKHHEIYGTDAGMEQAKFKIYEKIEHILGCVNWELAERAELLGSTVSI